MSNYGKAYDLVLSGKAPRRHGPRERVPQMRERYGMHTFGQSLLMARAPDRSRDQIRTGELAVSGEWRSGDDRLGPRTLPTRPLKNLHCPKLDRGLSRYSTTWTSEGC